jgi:hypothetical protein
MTGRGWLGVGLLAVAGCGGDRDDLMELAPPPPEPGALTIEAAGLPPSSISVPVDVSLQMLRDAVEEALPGSIGSLEERRTIPDNDRMSLAFEISRGPIETTFDRGRAEVGATLTYRVRAWYDPPILPAVSASCGTGEDADPPRLRVRLGSPVTLDRAWRLQTRVAAEAIEPASASDRDKCEMTLFGIDMTGRVIDGARAALESHATEIDALVADVDVRSDFEGWWETIAQPIRLADRTWLVLSPDSVHRGGIAGESGELLTTLTLHARPRVVVGERPDVEARPLPPLDSASVSRDSVRIVAEAVASYAEITERLADAVVGRSFEAQGRELEIDDLVVAGVGDGRISVQLNLVGDVRGTVFLVGTPQYDPDRDEIHVDDLDFDVRTRDRLVAGAAWIARAGLRQSIRSAARYPAAEARTWAEEKVGEGFNARISDEVRLEGSVGDVVIESVTAGPDAVRVRTVVTGRTTLIVGGG